ncbi:MAG: ribbon-helix-helix domain-containing protein [Gammaproteobacteria bacterium]|nr:ribbon-helix-helix domain-containing protein [Gammaproteobacteria bacterium]MCY4343385.1 ribbon-helix-helix domain-containing protein [Gammaproteobacteria bacterium]
MISLDDEQKAWLDRQAASRHASMASLIRQAVEEFREREKLGSAGSFRDALNRTSGIWQAGDGLEYQERIRGEWP